MLEQLDDMDTKTIPPRQIDNVVGQMITKNVVKQLHVSSFSKMSYEL